MKIRLISSVALLIFIISFFYSCSDDSVTAPPAPPVVQNLVKMDSGYVPGAAAIISFYAEDSLRLGYNKVYLVLYDSATNTLITNSHIDILPVNHGHSAPVENPGENAVEGKFPGAIVLTQAFPNGDLHWRFTFRVHNHFATGEPEGEVQFAIPRILDNPGKFKSFTMPDSTKLYVSYVLPKTPAVGMNDFEFTIHKNEPEIYPYDGSCSIEMNTQNLTNNNYPTGNVTPVHTSLGHYKGRINLDQNGTWRINLKIIRNSVWYDTNFEVNN